MMLTLIVIVTINITEIQGTSVRILNSHMQPRVETLGSVVLRTIRKIKSVLQHNSQKKKKSKQKLQKQIQTQNTWFKTVQTEGLSEFKYFSMQTTLFIARINAKFSNRQNLSEKMKKTQLRCFFE